MQAPTCSILIYERIHLIKGYKRATALGNRCLKRRDLDTGDPDQGPVVNTSSKTDTYWKQRMVWNVRNVLEIPHQTHGH